MRFFSVVLLMGSFSANATTFGEYGVLVVPMEPTYFSVKLRITSRCYESGEKAAAAATATVEKIKQKFNDKIATDAENDPNSLASFGSGGTGTARFSSYDVYGTDGKRTTYCRGFEVRQEVSIVAPVEKGATEKGGAVSEDLYKSVISDLIALNASEQDLKSAHTIAELYGSARGIVDRVTIMKKGAELNDQLMSQAFAKIKKMALSCGANDQTRYNVLYAGNPQFAGSAVQGSEGMLRLQSSAPEGVGKAMSGVSSPQFSKVQVTFSRAVVLQTKGHLEMSLEKCGEPAFELPTPLKADPKKSIKLYPKQGK